MFTIFINKKAKIIINDETNLDNEIKEELKYILNLYIRNYPYYETKLKKEDYFNEENFIRINLIQKEESSIDKINLGYLIKKKKLVLNDNLINFMFLRFNGLQDCICNLEMYLENNKDACQEQINLDFFKKELEKLKSLVSEYKEKMHSIETNIEMKIEFVKKLCETINWGLENKNSKCAEVLTKKDLHPKTFGVHKQTVLGSSTTDWWLYRYCNNNFIGFMIGKPNIICHKTVEWNILLNKYATLSAYYRKASFLRMFLINGTIMPHRRYPPLKENEKKGKKIGKLYFGPFILDIHYNKMDIENSEFTDRFFYKNLKFYDKNNSYIAPPLLRSSLTITYTEFRDLLCYLNLPVFRSTKNRNILFFPNYDLHQRLLAIQGLPRNYRIYTGTNIDWKWLKEGEVTDDVLLAQQQIDEFCKEYEESLGYGIEPVRYEWYEITFETENTKKYIFLVCTREEYHLHYSNLKYLTKNNKYYVYNDVIKEHALKKLRDDFKLKSPIIDSQESPKSPSRNEPQKSSSRIETQKSPKSSSRIETQKSSSRIETQKSPSINKLPISVKYKYLKYKRKYLELKSKYLELKKLE